jgi:hypothetical protein
MPLFMDVHEKVEEPTAQAVAARAVRREAHGLSADSTTEVQEGA